MPAKAGIQAANKYMDTSLRWHGNTRGGYLSIVITHAAFTRANSTPSSTKSPVA